MTILIYSDPHIGLTRNRHTTPASRAALRQSIYETTLDIAKTDDCIKVCGGDLFDQYSNPEEIISQGEAIVKNSDLVLAGNHDVTAREGVEGSLEFLSKRYGDKILSSPFNSCLAYINSLGEDGGLFSIPHCTTQELFESGLKQVEDLAKAEERNVPFYLLLHCNVDSPFELTETTLNLTSQRAEQLLETFDTIFVGHEHQPRDLFGGRLMVIGCPHPTGFSDISDKFVIVIENGEIRREKMWDAKEHYLQINADVNLAEYDFSDYQFIRIKGEVTAERQVELSKYVAKEWKKAPGVFAIWLDTKIEDQLSTDFKTPEGVLETLPQQITRELQGSPLLELWKEFTDAQV